MATKTFKIGLSNQDKTNMAQDVYERLLALTFPEYDPTASYSVGDFVVYNDQLYKCIGNTSGTWDSTKWQLATLNDLLTDIESAVAFVNDKANVDGNYPTMTVGNADQLNSTVYVVDKVPYLYRTSGGDADIGNREYDKIIGGSIVVNQLVQNGNFESTSGWSTTGCSLSVNNNIGTVTATEVFVNARIQRDITFVGHKYFVNVELNSSADCSIDILLGNNYAFQSYSNVANTWNKYEKVIQATGQYFRLYHDKNGATVGSTFMYKNVQIFDLTQMLGSTIADYIYALEQANAGAGVAWFRTYFKELYYPYNTGAIKSVKLLSHDMVGFNQWDEVWEVGSIDTATGEKITASDRIRSKNFIKVLPNTTYYILCSSLIRIMYYDENKNYITYSSYQDSGTITTHNNCSFICFNTGSAYGTTYKNDICINLSWSGWRNGQYEPYQKNSYELDTTIELRGIPKLDSDNHLYFDGDEYSSDGKVVRKDKDLIFDGSSDENWILQSINSNGIANFYIKIDRYKDAYNPICNRFSIQRTTIAQTTDEGYFLGGDNDELFIRIKSSTASTVEGFRTWLSNNIVEVVYESATPTEESADTYQEPQIVDDFGTEEYVVPTQDGWQVPVGHDTKYPANLRDKLQRLPDMPSVSQNVTETYVVNYNGTTKKCTFVDIDTWLGSNGYAKPVDLSSGITLISGVTVIKKQVTKIGNAIIVDINIVNNTGSAIAANTKIAELSTSICQRTVYFSYIYSSASLKVGYFQQSQLALKFNDEWQNERTAEFHFTYSL